MIGTVLVTGGAGFVGSHLTRRLLRDGCTVRVLDRDYEGAELGDAERVVGDIRDRELVRRVTRGCQTVFHCAAVLPISRAGREFWEVNVAGTRNVLDAAEEHGVEHVVHTSSSSVFGVPAQLPVVESSPRHALGPYSQSKIEAERICEEFRQRGLRVSIVRPRTTVGAGRLGIFSLLFEWIRQGRSVFTIGRGDNLFQFISVADLVEAMALVPQRSASGEDFNIGAAVFRTVREDLSELCERAGTGARVVSLPGAPARLLIGVLSQLRLIPLVEWHYMTADKPFYFAIDKARNILGWEPRDSNMALLGQAYDYYVDRRRSGLRSGTTHRTSVRPGILGVLPFLRRR